MSENGRRNGRDAAGEADGGWAPVPNATDPTRPSANLPRAAWLLHLKLHAGRRTTETCQAVAKGKGEQQSLPLLFIGSGLFNRPPFRSPQIFLAVLSDLKCYSVVCPIHEVTVIAT